MVISIIVALAAGFGGGVLFSQSDGAGENIIQNLINRDDGRPENVDFSLFWKAWETLNVKYVDNKKINQQDLLYGAIKGMINSVGDPYTVFFEPSLNKKFQEEISGSFGGVGIEIGKKDDVLTVIAPLKNTPAFKAGLQAGDKILKIDTKSTESMTIEEAVGLIRGRRGTKVTLTISTNGNTKEVELIRDTIQIPTVEWTLVENGRNKIAYLQIFSFNRIVDSEFNKAASEILNSSANSLIIDLRNNPGGLLDSAINLSGWFLDKNQVVVSEVFSDGAKNDFRSSGNGALKDYPTIILVNGGSASASEILAGALRDNKNVRIVGEKTFGKGSVQELVEFSGGSSLKVTTAKWLTPKGVSISEKGIEPDFEIEITDEQRESGEIEIGQPGKDPQLDKALDLF